MKKTWCIGLLLLLPLILKAQIFEEDGYQLTRMTNLSHEINKVDAEGFSMSGLCFAHFEKGDLNFMNITIGTTTPYDFEEEHCSVILVFLEDQIHQQPIRTENILELSSFTHPEQANGIWVVNCTIKLSLAQIDYMSHHPLAQIYINFKHGEAGMGLCYDISNSESGNIQLQAQYLADMLKKSQEDK